MPIEKLSDKIDRLNNYLKQAGAMVRFECESRNDYQAVDEYSVDIDGKRIGTGVNRTVCTGIGQEVYCKAYSAYLNIVFAFRSI